MSIYTVFIYNRFSEELELECEVTHYYHKPADRGCMDSDMDYHGYTELEYTVLGYDDMSVTDKLAVDDNEDVIELDILEQMGGEL